MQDRRRLDLPGQTKSCRQISGEGHGEAQLRATGGARSRRQSAGTRSRCEYVFVCVCVGQEIVAREWKEKKVRHPLPIG